MMTSTASLESSLLASFHLAPLKNVYSADSVHRGEEDEEWEEYWDEEEDEEEFYVEGGGDDARGGGGSGTGAAGGASGSTSAAPVSIIPQQREPRAPPTSTSASSSSSSSSSSAATLGNAPALRDKLLDSYRDRVFFGAIEQAQEEGVTRHTGRDDRATVEQVLDPRTRMVLFKLLAQGFISRICGCVSTGKEANVYYAERPGGLPPVALKIFKTSILVFKDRDRYVSGEFRFRSGYARSNPRKMVKLWAEKEMRNLKRLEGAGLAVPTPLLLRLHVLVMDFLGVDGWPSPRLKDAVASIPPSRLAEAYIELVDAMRFMWSRCDLVHGDLSEYNVLWHGGGPVIIDVSQSVESDHPRALEFLRIDCGNVGGFFAKHGVVTLGVRDTFDYVVHTGLKTRAEEVAFLEAARERAEARGREGEGEGGEGDEEGGEGGGEMDGEVYKGKDGKGAGGGGGGVDEAVFMATDIPRSLSHIRDVEREGAKGRMVAKEDVFHSAITGVGGGGGVEGAGGGGGGGGQ